MVESFDVTKTKSLNVIFFWTVYNLLTYKRISRLDTKRRLKRALSAIDDAMSTLRRARSKVEDGRSDISRALNELDDAETNIRKAIRELPDDI
ncbi:MULTISPECIES: hypothetical protein [Yersinia]|uniref:hypothetical protein n=1 Tax=Yersinia TaxID=629 RepID=UPI00067C812F|nr:MULTISPECIES: hypothetical protein [Yersinia]ELX2301347.1 hypothetical protein [Yersinia enterocolitica]HEI6908896.1 hypothetical protein [Yersinia enterocolitica]HEN3395137.1 hypothetical protein [Yersinia enterocolitica]